MGTGVEDLAVGGRELVEKFIARMENGGHAHACAELSSSP